MKKTLCVLFAAVLLLAVSIPAMAATNMKLAHNLAEDHAVHIQLTAFADAVREKTGGEINIEVVPNGTLGSEGAVLEQVGYGMVEMTKVSAATLGNFASEWNALSVPYVFNDQEHYYNVMDGEIAKDLYLTTEDQGFIGLFWLDSGARSFYTKDKAIRTPADLAGLKIRTMDSQMAIDMMAAMGGSATVMSYSEIYTGMQQGVIDGAENNVTALRDHGDVTKYYCFDAHTRIPYIVVISTDTWNSLTEEQQQIMMECAAAASDEYKARWAAFEEEVMAAADGVEFIRDVDIPAFQAACAGIYENLKNTDPTVYSIVEKIQEAGK